MEYHVSTTMYAWMNREADIQGNRVGSCVALARVWTRSSDLSVYMRRHQNNRNLRRLRLRGICFLHIDLLQQHAYFFALPGLVLKLPSNPGLLTFGFFPAPPLLPFFLFFPPPPFSSLLFERFCSLLLCFIS